MGPTTQRPHEQYQVPKMGTEFSGDTTLDFRTSTVPITYEEVSARRDAMNLSTSSSPEVASMAEIHPVQRAAELSNNLVLTRGEVTLAA